MASIISDSGRQQSLAVNVMVGVAGALTGGMLIGPFLGMGDIDNFGLSFPSVLISLLSAVLLLTLVNKFPRREERKRRAR